MNGIVQAIAEFLGALKEGICFWRQKDAQKNTADVKAAAVAQDEVNAQDQARTAIAKQDVKATQQGLAE
jgi:hypothetical protein